MPIPLLTKSRIATKAMCKLENGARREASARVASAFKANTLSEASVAFARHPDTKHHDAHEDLQPHAVQRAA